MGNIISLSGGKDSTAMLLECLRCGVEVDHCVFFDTGWEFPGMIEHIDLLEKNTGVEIVRLEPPKSFEYQMLKQRIIKGQGKKTGKVHRVGNGWPSPMRRWCTGVKVAALEKHFQKQGLKNICVFIGYAADEAHRTNRVTLQNKRYKISYPLIDWNIDEKEALQICKDGGYTWGGLYEHFRRVSCFCCPLQQLGELRRLRKFYPELWQKMLEMDASIENNRGFRDYKTVHDMERRFANEDLQQSFNF